MALFKCPDCKNRVSESSQTCPKCGAPVTRDVIERERKAALKRPIILCVLGALFLWFLFGNRSTLERGNQQAGSAPAARAAGCLNKSMDELKASVAASLLASSHSVLTALDQCKSVATTDVEKTELAALVAEYKEKARLEDAEKALQLRKADPQQQWQYLESTDDLTGRKIKAAALLSKNSLDLEFPYDGNNYGWLRIRHHPQYGYDIYLKIQRGQIQCRSYSPCKIKVKFDDGPVLAFNGTGPNDGGTETVFLSDFSEFFDRAKKAKKILIQFPVYRGGEVVYEFNTIDSLIW